jgi:hypothetical protein
MTDLAKDILGQSPAKVKVAEAEPGETPRASVFGESRHSAEFGAAVDGKPPAAVSPGRCFAHSAAFEEFSADHVANLHGKPKPFSKFGETGKQFDEVYGGKAQPGQAAEESEEELPLTADEREAMAVFDRLSDRQKLRMLADEED